MSVGSLLLHAAAAAGRPSARNELLQTQIPRKTGNKISSQSSLVSPRYGKQEHKLYCTFTDVVRLPSNKRGAQLRYTTNGTSRAKS